MGPIRVLVVEDDPTQRWLLLDFLENTEGLEPCGQAADGLTGLELARREEADLILLDLILPGISGMELLRRYRREGGRSKILVVTRAAGPAVSAAALSAGADFFLAKPVLFQELAEDIRSLCGDRRQQFETLLQQMGAKPKCLGYRQAIRALEILGSGRVELMKEAYLQVASESRSTYACVEKNIRSLIRQIYQTGSKPYRKLTGCSETDRPPANGDFLRALLASAKFPL